jgi:hypothetical protein
MVVVVGLGVIFVLSKFMSLHVFFGVLVSARQLVFGVLVSARQLFFVCLMSSWVDFGGLVSDRQMFFVQTFFVCIVCLVG